MTKSELVTHLYAQWKENHFSVVSRAEVQEAVDRILDLLAEALAAGERIELRDFGVFHLQELSARQGRNPRTGAPVAVPAQKAIRFRAGRAMRIQVDHG